MDTGIQSDTERQESELNSTLTRGDVSVERVSPVEGNIEGHPASRGSPPPAYQDIHRHPVISEATDQINGNLNHSNNAQAYHHYQPGQPQRAPGHRYQPVDQQHAHIPRARRLYYQEPLHGQHWTIIPSHRGRNRAEDEAFVNQMVLDVNRRTVERGSYGSTSNQLYSEDNRRSIEEQAAKRKQNQARLCCLYIVLVTIVIIIGFLWIVDIIP